MYVNAGSVTFQCAIKSNNGTVVQWGLIPKLLFYGPTAVGCSSSLATTTTVVSSARHSLFRTTQDYGSQVIEIVVKAPEFSCNIIIMLDILQRNVKLALPVTPC